MSLKEDNREEHQSDVPSDLPEDPSLSYNPERARMTRSRVAVPKLSNDMSHATLVDVPEDEAESDVEILDSGEDDLPTVRDSGSFHLEKLVGQGGYGEVWCAKQTSLGRDIALKRLRHDIFQRNADDPHVLALLERTFQNEAFIMGVLDHPNIVPIYDLRADDIGRMQLAMKLVRGKQWSRLMAEDRAHLPRADFLAKHLTILIQVAQAVAFAHSRGVLHRDIKPGQVMVGEFGEVLLMDWGLALLFDVELARASGADTRVINRLPTRRTAHSPSGTVAFMAPEQTEKSAANTGPWTDIYLLGGTLYYLLTGTAPHSAPDSQAAFLQAMAGDISPPRDPLAADLPQELLRLARSAMNPDRTRRIPSAREFVTALQDYLSGAGRRRESADLTDQVRMRASSAPEDYRELTECASMLGRARTLWPENPEYPRLREEVFRKLAELALKNGDLVLARVQAERLHEDTQRNRLLQLIDAQQRHALNQRRHRQILVATTAILFVAAMLAFIRQSEKAETAEVFDRVNALRRAENSLAERLSRNIELPRTLSVDETRPADNGTASAEATKLMAEREELRKERFRLEENDRVRNRLEEEPFPLLLAEANLLMTHGRTRDEYARAYEIYSHAAKLRPNQPEPLIGMGVAAFRRGNKTLATQHLDEACRLALERRGPRSSEYAHVLALTADAYQQLDETAEAYKTYYRRSLEILESSWADLSLGLATYYGRLGEYRKAMDYARPVAALRKELGAANTPPYFEAMDVYLENLYQLGNFVDMEPLAEEDLRAREHAFGAEHPLVAKGLWNYARVLAKRGKREEARVYFERSIAMRRKLLGNEHPETARTLNDMAEVILFSAKNSNDEVLLQRTVREAELLLTEALRIREKVLGPDHPAVAETLRNLADVYWEETRYEEANRLRQRADAINKEIFEAGHPAISNQYRAMANSYRGLGRYSEAELLLKQALTARERAYGKDSYEVMRVLQLLALLYIDQARHSEAEKVLEREQPMARAAREPYVGAQSLGLTYLGDIAADKGLFDEAEQRYREALAVLDLNGIKNDYIYRKLAVVLARAGRSDEARAAATLSLRHRLETLKFTDPEQALYFDNVAETAVLLGMNEHARLLYIRNAEYSREALGELHNNSLDSTQLVLALTPPPSMASEEQRRLHIVANAWLVLGYESRKETNTNDFIDARGLGWLPAQVNLARAVAAWDPAKRAVAQRLAVRAVQLARVARLPADHPFLVNELEPLMTQLDILNAPSLLPPIPEELWAARPHPIPTRKIMDFLNTSADVKGWQSEISNVPSWNIADVMQPQKSELQALAEKALAELKDAVAEKQ